MQETAFAIPFPAQPTPESFLHCNMHATPSVKGLAFWGEGRVSVLPHLCEGEKKQNPPHMRPPFKKTGDSF